MFVARLTTFWCFSVLSCSACSCLFQSAKAAFESTPIIFIGHVERIETKVDPGKKWSFKNAGSPHFTTQTAVLQVDEPFKGATAGTTFATADEGLCSRQFVTIGDKYLIYAFSQKDPAVISIGCTRSRRLKDAGDDLLFIRSLPASAQRNRVSGTISLVHSFDPKMFETNDYVAGIHVIITGDDCRSDLVTDASGAFELSGLKAGTYQIRLVKPESDSIYMWYFTGAAPDIPPALLPGEKLQPAFVVGEKSGIEIDFVLVPSDLLKKKKSRR